MSYEQWNSELEETLRKRGVSAKEIDQAREYWYEAYRDRIESGMDEEAAVNDLGSVDAAAASVVESMPTIQRSFCNLRQNHERTALVTVLLVLGAIAWVPVVFAIAMLAVAVYVLLWSLILAAWAFVASRVPSWSNIGQLGCRSNGWRGLTCNWRCRCALDSHCHPGVEHPLPGIHSIWPLGCSLLRARGKGRRGRLSKRRTSLILVVASP